MAYGSPNTAALEELITSYNEMNSAEIEEMDEEPSPLEFMRFVSRNTPFVMRGCASTWKASQRWNATYLKSVLQGQTVNVAVTPKGNADSPTHTSEFGLVFAKPHYEDQPFSEFLDYVIQQEKDPSPFPEDEVRYAQTQNDNFRDEYATLLPDAHSDIPFARIALQKRPEAVNLWIGNSHSITATHKDNFENIFVQIRGRKHFSLLPPVCYPCMNEIPLRHAKYVRKGNGLVLKLDDGEPRVPFVTWDSDNPHANCTALSPLAAPLKVTLNPGDMLYLPALWYHKVSQSCADGDEGFVLGVNYWYDMDFTGPLHPLGSLVRNITLGHQEEHL